MYLTGGNANNATKEIRSKIEANKQTQKLGVMKINEFQEERICKVFIMDGSLPVIVLDKSYGDGASYYTYIDQEGLEAYIAGNRAWNTLFIRTEANNDYREKRFVEDPNQPLYKLIPSFIVEKSTVEVKQVETIERNFKK